MTEFAKSPDLEAHIRASWKEAHDIWKNLYKEGSPIMALLPIHDLLSAKHDDTVPASVVAGDMIYGDATPKWAKFAPNTSATKKYLSMTSSVPAWEEVTAGSETDPVFVASPAYGITADDIIAWDTAFGWGDHAGLYSLLAHNHSGVYEPVLGNPAADGYILSSTALGVRSWIAPGGGGAHDLLSATHGDTTAAAVVRGDVMIGVGATPKWARLADVAAGAYFRSGGVGIEPLWSTLILPNAATAFRLPVATAANTIGELAAVGATGEYLAGVTGAIPAWATLNQAAVDGLKSTQGPTFDYVNLGGKAIQTTCKARAYLSALQYVNHDVWTKILIDTESYDTGNNFTSYKFTAPVAGYYLICANIWWQGIDVGKPVYVAIYIDGVLAYYRSIVTDSMGTGQPQFTDIIYLTAAQYVEVYGYYYSAGNTGFAASGAANTAIAIHLLSI